MFRNNPDAVTHFANQIATVVNSTGLCAEVASSDSTGSVMVTVRHAGRRFETAIPADGAMFPLWLDGAWVGGMNVRHDDTTINGWRRAAGALADRIAELAA